jgi:hypothetical protein
MGDKFPGRPDVIFWGDPEKGASDLAQLELAAGFYGATVRCATDWAGFRKELASPASGESGPILLAVHAAATRELDQAALDEWRELTGGLTCPLAYIGLSPDYSLPEAFGAGELHVRAQHVPSGSRLWTTAKSAGKVGYELRDVALTFSDGKACCLAIESSPSLEVFCTIGQDPTTAQPALIRVEHRGQALYFLSSTTGATAAPWNFRRSHFGDVAPYFLLLRDAGGKRCWLPPAPLANFTIDDPWLREPFGCLSFSGLLAEMQRERFHTTIGFVPWNFDRSANKVVELIRGNPEHFSVAIHGNNHDRYEFFRYESLPGDQQRAKSLAEQEANIRQAVARMAEFRRLTNISPEPVMVFPHGISPAPTLEVLQRHGFLATSNYSNIPLGEQANFSLADSLRAVCTHWYDFPALRRMYPQHWSDEFVALELFLGNPVLIMAHQDLFFDGIEVFSPLVRRINSRQPAVRWVGLGEIARRLYLMRWPQQDRCEVLMMSRAARFENTTERSVTFDCVRPEQNPQTVVCATVNGGHSAIEYVAGRFRLVFQLPPGNTALVEFHGHATSIDAVPVRRRGLRNRILRFVADLRDLHLSHLSFGRDFTRKYYRDGKRRPTLSGLLKRLKVWRG